MAEIAQRVERVVAILDENKTAFDAVTLMTDKHIGSVVVTSDSKVSGIFTERDLMRRVVCERKNPEAVKLRDVMRKQLISVEPQEKVEQCLSLMRDNRCRHLLVFDGEKFMGIVSMRDMVLLLLEEKERLIQDLTRYITG